MGEIERRPHLQRACPFRMQEGCEWVQTTSWFMGGPDVTEPVSGMVLQMEAEAHFLSAHRGKAPKMYFT